MNYNERASRKVSGKVKRSLIALWVLHSAIGLIGRSFKNLIGERRMWSALPIGATSAAIAWFSARFRYLNVPVQKLRTAALTESAGTSKRKYQTSTIAIFNSNSLKSATGTLRAFVFAGANVCSPPIQDLSTECSEWLHIGAQSNITYDRQEASISFKLQPI